MPIDSICSGCGKALRVSDEFEGRKARCPNCGTIFVAVAGAIAVPVSTDLTSPDPALRETTYSPSANANSPNSPNLASDNPTKYTVRTPNQLEYGPIDSKTVFEWVNQGRLDDTCHIRAESSQQWIGLAAWRFQLKREQSQVASSYASTIKPMERFASMDSFQFGSAPVATNQSAGYARAGNGGVVLALGIVSWVLCFTVLGALICATVAVVLGIKELAHIREGRSPQSDRLMVLFGLWLGILNLVAVLASLIVIIAIAILNP